MILAGGTVLTLALLANKKGIIDPVQKAASEDKPLGPWANFGDTMGQSVPNALYAGGMYLHHSLTKSARSLERAYYMFDTTAYAGLTTVVLKRLIRQRRPNKGDRLSFPSGHTTTAFAFATTVAIEHEWYYGVGAMLIAGIVGYSRINDNAHYLHDVVFGATLATAYGVALKKFHTQASTSLTLSPLYINEDKYGLLLSYRY